MTLDTEELVYIPAEDIRVVDGRNKRFHLPPKDHEQLVESIRTHGVKKPIEVQMAGDDYHLIDGHRRHAACLEILAKYSPVPKVNGRPVTHLKASILPIESEVDVLAHMLIANDSKPFNPLEEASMLDELKEQSGLDIKALAKMVGKSVSHVSDRLALLGAADEIQEAVEDGTITPSDATTIVRKSHGNQETQKEFVEKVKVEGRQVIKKELTKGRYKKDQWEVAEEAYDDCQAALLSPEVFIRDIPDPNNLRLIIEHILTDPNLEAAFQLGRVTGIGALGHLTPAETMNKLSSRVNGVNGHYTEEGAKSDDETEEDS